MGRYGVRMTDQETWARDVARDLMADELPRRWAHVHAAAERARSAAPMAGDDGELLVCTAMLHDVGYAAPIAHTGFHPLDGARHLRGIAAPPRLVNLVAHHSCATVEATLRGLTSELAEFEDEKSPIRDALWWVDMTTSPTGELTTVSARVDEIQQRYGLDHVVSQFVRAAWPELLGAVERTERRLRDQDRT